MFSKSSEAFGTSITPHNEDDEDDSFDYVNVDGTMDESQADLLRLTQALGSQLPQKTSVQTDRLRSKISTVSPGLQADVALTPKHGGRN